MREHRDLADRATRLPKVGAALSPPADLVLHIADRAHDDGPCRDGPSRVRFPSLAAQILPLSVVLLATLVGVLPAWSARWYQDDQLPSVFRTLNTDLAHHEGVFFPTMAFELGFGYGQLLHQIYPPFGSELSAWLHALGFGYMGSVRAYFSLCLVVGALGTYGYGLAVLRARLCALLAAVTYAWAPYLLLDIHPGGDFGESLGMALVPWSLLAFHALLTRGTWTRFTAAALGLAAVALAHNITALFLTGLLCLYVAASAARHARVTGRTDMIAAFARSTAAAVLALALSAIYWVPALVEMPASRVGEQREGAFSLARYLLPVNGLLQRTLVFSYGRDDQHRYALIPFSLTVLALVAVGGALVRRRPLSGTAEPDGEARPDRLAVGGCGLVFAAVLALQLAPARPIWDTVPLISFVQFPRRLYVFATLASSILVGALPWALERLGARPGVRLAVVGMAAALFAVAGLPGVYLPPPPAASHALDESQATIGSSADRRNSQRSYYDDFFPAWVTERQVDVPRPPSRPELYRDANSLPAPHLTFLERGYRQVRFIADADVPSAVVLHTFFFPGWRATADGLSISVDPIGPLGVTRVSIPPGRHDVVVTFGDTPLRVTAMALSVSASTLLIAALVRGLGIRRAVVGLVAVGLAVAVPWAVHLAMSPAPRSTIEPLDLDVTANARLVGVEWREREYAPSQPVRVTALWQATDWTPADLQSGLRLVAVDSGALLAERWSRPNLDRTPTAKWVLGEVVPDPLSVRIPSDAPPGRYRVLVGLRDGERPALGSIGEVVIR